MCGNTYHIYVPDIILSLFGSVSYICLTHRMDAPLDLYIYHCARKQTSGSEYEWRMVQYFLNVCIVKWRATVHVNVETKMADGKQKLVWPLYLSSIYISYSSWWTSLYFLKWQETIICFTFCTRVPAFICFVHVPPEGPCRGNIIQQGIVSHIVCFRNSFGDVTSGGCWFTLWLEHWMLIWIWF